MDRRPFIGLDLQRIRERKIVQAVLAYGAAAWLLLQVLQLLSDTYDWPPGIVRGVPVLLVTGLFSVIVLAWFHGERGQQRVSGVEASILAALLIVGLAGSVFLGKTGKKQGLPLVMIMDSPAPERVYDEETVRNNGTNADVISDILLDLPIRRQKEAIGPGWHRDEEVRQFNPDLIIIHFSAFCRGSACLPTLGRFRQFVEYFADTDTQFLIYSRGPDSWTPHCGKNHGCEKLLRALVDSVFAPDYREYPTLQRRIQVFAIRDYGPPNWLDPTVASAFKLRARRILEVK